MAYTVTDGRIGIQPIATTSTVRNHPLGMIVRASDPTYGEAEFIYLTGVASTAAGASGSNARRRSPVAGLTLSIAMDPM